MIYSSDSTFDLVNFIWKASVVSEKATLEEDLKMKCLTPNVSQLCADLEERFGTLLTDFQSLGDSALKEFMSLQLADALTQFFEEASYSKKEDIAGKGSKTDWFLGRFATALIDLCPTLWKLLEKSVS